MKFLFLTTGRMESIESHSLYPDLLRYFRNNGHEIYVVSPRERRTQLKTELIETDHVHMLYVQIGNITKCSFIEKGISTVLIESQFKNAIKKYFPDTHFDVVMYSTPPITLVGVVKYIKKRYHAKSYLLLKDIFPQNAADLHILTKKGIKGLLYDHFRKQEKSLYAVSDKIGCMSPANAAYVLAHNPQIAPEKVEVCPNCVEPLDLRVSRQRAAEIRKQYGLPFDKKIFVYGGNLGRPQDVPFIVECFKACADIPDAYFIVAGSGTDRHYLETYVKEAKPSHVRLMGHMPKEEYDAMIACCDVGLIFLDNRFTIPNFPSRLLAYMQAGLPVLACTDIHTDIGTVITEGDFGWWCQSDDASGFSAMIRQIISDAESSLWPQKAENGMNFLNREYNVEKAYHTIMRAIQK